MTKDFDPQIVREEFLVKGDKEKRGDALRWAGIEDGARMRESHLA